MGKSPLPFLAAAAALLFGGCLNDGPREREITWRLSDSLETFDSVVILIADASGNPLDTVFRGKLDYPALLPPYRVPAETPAAFRVHILGLGRSGDTQYVSFIRVNGDGAEPFTPFRRLLLDSLKVSTGAFLSPFSALEPEYYLVGAAADSLSVTIFPTDPAGVDLEFNGRPASPGVPSVFLPVPAGRSFFRVKILAKDGSGWTAVRITVDR